MRTSSNLYYAPPWPGKVYAESLFTLRKRQPSGVAWWRFSRTRVSWGPGVVGSETVAPMWARLLPLGIPTIWLFHRDRRSVRWAKAGRCAACGYDVAGLAVCPECGKAVAA